MNDEKNKVRLWIVDVKEQKNTIDKTPKSNASRRFSNLIRICETVRNMSLVFSAVAVVAVLVLSMVNDVLSLYKSDARLEISSSDIPYLAEKLKDGGIIQHPALFSFYMSLKGSEPSLNEGDTVMLRGDMDYNQIINAFSGSRQPEIIRLTFPKGATTDEIIDIFVENGIGTREGFEEVINCYPFEFDFVEVLGEYNGEKRKYRLDGYLYPDTYDFYKGRNEAYYIYKFLDRFDSVTEDIRAEDNGLSLDELLRLASMIQCSTPQVSQYEQLSAVFWNRLREPDKFPCLECPASSMYGMGKKEPCIGRPSEVITEADTLYNTFLYGGLPPGAICNPDINAIICAARPSDNDFYYFVAVNGGEVLFAETRSEYDKLCQDLGRSRSVGIPSM